MADLRTIDRDHTAVLIMDYQQDIVPSVAAHQPLLLERAAAVLSGPRFGGRARHLCRGAFSVRLSRGEQSEPALPGPQSGRTPWRGHTR